jgi:hypothetical protein
MESSHYQLHSDRIIPDSKVKLQYLLCALCKNILWDPEKCSNCKIHYCKFCITFSLLKGKKCPICITEYKKSNADIYLLEDLSELIVKCVYCINGCSLTLNYNMIKQHEEECIYREMECEDCHIKILKKYYHTHIVICKNSSSANLLIDCKQIVSYYQDKLNKLEKENLEDIANLKKYYNDAYTQKQETIDKLIETIKKQYKMLDQIVKDQEKMCHESEENTKIGNKINCNFI